MPERERLNIDFGFAPTQVQQRDIGAAYAAPVARKSAKTKMFEGLAQLSGTLLTAYAGYSKRQRAEEKAWNSLSSEDKTKYDNAAKEAAAATAAGDASGAEVILARYSAELVEAGKMPATHHQYFHDRLTGFTAVNDLSTKLEAHFTPEVRASLSNGDTDINDYINKVIHGTQQDSEGNTVSIGLDRDTLDNLDHSLVQTLIASRKSSLTPQIQAAQDRIATENFTNNAVASTAAALSTIIDDNSNVTPEQLKTAWTGTVDALSTTAFKQVFNESGVNKLFPAFETTFDKYIADGPNQSLTEASTLLEFIGHSGHKGNAVHGNKTFYDMNPEKANGMLAKLHAAEESQAATTATQRRRLNAAISEDSDAAMDGRLFDISELGEQTANFTAPEFLKNEVAAFEASLDPNLVTRLKAHRPDELAWKGFINSYSAKLSALQDATIDTKPSFEWAYNNLLKDGASDKVIESYLDASLMDTKTLSAPDYTRYKTALRTRKDDTKKIKDYDARYTNNNQGFKDGLKSAIGAYAKLDLGIINTALKNADTADSRQVGKQAYVLAIMVKNAEFQRSEFKRSLLKFDIEDKFVHEALVNWENDLYRNLSNGTLGVIKGGGYYVGNVEGNLSEAYENLENLE
tara:strand:- start:14631 stop:16526 length:1896 start_codon:yes stop_codon:yes gene_type:complete